VIRDGNLSRVERMVAGAIGLVVAAACVFVLAATAVRGPRRAMLAAFGGLAIAWLFIVVALTGRPVGRRGSRTNEEHRESRRTEKRRRTVD
jgi:hypothetical protein